MKLLMAVRRFLEAFSINRATTLERRLAEAEAANVRLIKGISEVLESAHWAVTTSSEDWAATFDKAWLYGLFVGWDCEEDHEHDQDCGGPWSLEELAHRGLWPPPAVAKLRSLRSTVRALEDLEAEL